MFYYLKGTCSLITSDSIILDVNNVGYELLVARPKSFSVGVTTFLYVYHVIKEDAQYFIGFKDLKEKRLFLSLNEVKGIGPKTALNILSNASLESIINAIASNNIIFLRHIPGVGSKVAAQILLDLKGKYSPTNANIEVFEDVRLALKKLGYKYNVIDEVLATIDCPNGTNDEILTMALKKLKK